MPSRNDLEIEIVDKLSAFLADNVDLPPYTLQKYRRPRAVLPDDCPLLTIWLVHKGMLAATTNNFDSRINIGISWQIDATDRATTLEEDEDAARDLLRQVGEIQHWIRYLGVHGWPEGETISEAYEVLPLSVDYLPPMALETGLIEGYAMTVQVAVVEQV